MRRVKPLRTEDDDDLVDVDQVEMKVRSLRQQLPEFSEFEQPDLKRARLGLHLAAVPTDRALIQAQQPVLILARFFRGQGLAEQFRIFGHSRQFDIKAAVSAIAETTKAPIWSLRVHQ